MSVLAQRYLQGDWVRLKSVSLIALAVACAPGPASADLALGIRNLASRPDAVSGDSILVELDQPHSPWTTRLNGHDVTNSFRSGEQSQRQIALLTGLKPGKNVLEVYVKHDLKATLEVINHPLSGPIFSGPHQEPFICQTVENGLGPPMDSNCTAAMRVQYYYKAKETSPTNVPGALAGSTPPTFSAGFNLYAPQTPPRAVDIAQVTISDGQRVPYIVRRETGTLNRAVYDIQFLHQPGQPLPNPWTSSTPGWNKRLIYSFGGGCSAGYRQGVLDAVIGAAQEALLTQGYALATSTLNVSAISCNNTISAETLSMVKEHFIKHYGPPVHTIGVGVSGGAVQQHLIAQNYPGLLDGIVVAQSFPDDTSDAQIPFDCLLLDQFFQASKMPWTEVQKSAVSGFATWRTCMFRAVRARDYLDPRSCNSLIPKQQTFDSLRNPAGLRCDMYENEANFYGRDPQTGLVRRPLDNVGVQYGLAALNAGKITTQQFIELNDQIGGFDEHGLFTQTRIAADADTIRLAYERGLVLTGGGGLSQIPIIDWRAYTDDLGDIHDFNQSFMTRARLVAANGQADNQVIVVFPFFFENPLYSSTIVTSLRQRDLLRHMDSWLNNINADNAPGSVAEKVERAKPLELSSGCWLVNGQRINSAITDDALEGCNEMYPVRGNPRRAAGAPPANDVLKCKLKPIRQTDYSQPMTVEEWQVMKRIFATGVCDYSQPGIEQRITTATWQRYTK